jgi:hypothetical protein
MANKIAMGPIIKALRHAYQRDEALRTVCDELAARGRSTRSTSVDRAHERTGLDRAAVVDVFRRLEKLDLGKFVVGRRGQPSRLEWRYRLQDVGQAAAGEITEIEEAIGVDEEEASASRTTRHTFQLRPESAVTLDLPSDLTQHEAQRLAEFIKTLPFA